MNKRKFFYILAALFALLLLKWLFPSMRDDISQGAGELLGLGCNFSRTIESMGDGFAEEGLHNSIIAAFEELSGGELYPADSIKNGQ